MMYQDKIPVDMVAFRNDDLYDSAMVVEMIHMNMMVDMMHVDVTVEMIHKKVCNKYATLWGWYDAFDHDVRYDAYECYGGYDT